MKFALGMPGLILYPPIMGRWEPGASPAELVGIARRADRLGFDALTISEHIVMPDEMAGAMGRRFPDSLAAAAVLAGATERIRLLTYVLVLPLRNPVVLAKQAATVDFLSNGRLLLGVGIGHAAREFEAIGVPFERRGARADEHIEAMRELWTSDIPSYHGDFVEFSGIAFEPKPVQKPHPPVLIGGNSKPAMRRAARYGDGWLPWLIKRDAVPACLDFIRSQPGSRANAPAFEVVMPVSEYKVEDYSHRELGETALPRSTQQMIDAIGLYREAGVTTAQVAPPRTESREQFEDWIEWFGAEVMTRFR
jgi:probable F420-dependent oxidoreductase